MSLFKRFFSHGTLGSFKSLRLLGFVIALLLPNMAYAELPNNELTFDFIGPSGNTGGTRALGVNYRYKYFEATVLTMNQSFLGMAMVRKNFHEDGLFVPYIDAGLEVPQFYLVLGLGVEVLAPPVSFIVKQARFGLRLDTYAFVPVLQASLAISPFLLVGITCHF